MPALGVLRPAPHGEQVHDVEAVGRGVHEHDGALVEVHAFREVGGVLFVMGIGVVLGRYDVDAVLFGEETGCAAHAGAPPERLGLVHGHGVVGHQVAVPLPAVVPGEGVAEVGEAVEAIGVEFQGEVVALPVADQGGVVEADGPGAAARAGAEDADAVAVQQAGAAGDAALGPGDGLPERGLGIGVEERPLDELPLCVATGGGEAGVVVLLEGEEVLPRER